MTKELDLESIIKSQKKCKEGGDGHREVKNQ